MNLKVFLGGVHFKIEKESELRHDDAEVATLSSSYSISQLCNIVQMGLRAY